MAAVVSCSALFFMKLIQSAVFHVKRSDVAIELANFIKPTTALTLQSWDMKTVVKRFIISLFNFFQTETISFQDVR